MSKSVTLHIGTHRTGTTALQRVLGRYAGLLGKSGISVYRGMYRRNNHLELHMAAMRPDRPSPGKERFKIVADETFRQKVGQHIQGFVEQSDAKRIVFSNEGLSYLRFPDELAFLRGLFPGCDVEVVVYLRDKAAFLSSYRHILWRRRRLRPRLEGLSQDRTSFAYCEPDSWLVDYDALVGAYRNAFDSVTVRDYDADLAAFGGTVGSFLTLLGLDPTTQSKIGEPRQHVSFGPTPPTSGIL